MPRNSFLPGDRVVCACGRRGRVWRVDGISGTIRVAFDDRGEPETVDPFHIEHMPEQRMTTDVLGFDERERRAVAEVTCRSCDAKPGEDCTSVFDRAQRLPHPHYMRWCDVVVERQVLPPEAT